MKSDILEKIKQESRDMKRIVNRDYSEIEELKRDPAVQRYLYLMELKDSRDLAESGESIVPSVILSKYGSGEIKETNNIWCFIYEAPAKNMVGVTDEEVSGYDDDQVLALYYDIENNTKRIVVKKEDRKAFEAANKVVFGSPHIYDGFDRYFNTRYHFFSDCISDGQEKAVERILARPKW